MGVDLWEQHKYAFLSKADKSFKKSIDRPILDLVSDINASDCFFTTSSCSGRIMMIQESGTKRKNGANFIFVSHDLIDVVESKDILGRIVSLEGNVFLKLEPLIIHVECRTLEYSAKLLHALKAVNQFKHTSIVSTSNSKFIVCIKAMPKLEIPIMYTGEVLVTVELLEKYLFVCNERMKENFEAISALETLIRDGLLSKLELIVTPAIDMRRPAYIEKTCYPFVNPEDFKKLHPFEVGSSMVSHDARNITLNGVPFPICPDRGESPAFDDIGIHYEYHISNRLTLFVFVNDEVETNVWFLIRKERRKLGVKFSWKKVVGEFPCKSSDVLSVRGNSNESLTVINIKSATDLCSLQIRWS